jgi:hypothetical protein
MMGPMCCAQVVLNSGVHDLGRADFTLGDYAARLNGLFAAIRAATPPPSGGGSAGTGKRPHLIWMSTSGVYLDPHAPAATYQNRTVCPAKGDARRGYSHPVPVLREMDAIARHVAAEHGADILDQARVRELSAYDGEGLHCLKGVVCQGTFDMLLQLIALGSPRQADRAGS